MIGFAVGAVPDQGVVHGFSRLGQLESQSHRDGKSCVRVTRAYPDTEKLGGIFRRGDQIHGVDQTPPLSQGGVSDRFREAPIVPGVLIGELFFQCFDGGGDILAEVQVIHFGWTVSSVVLGGAACVLILFSGLLNKEVDTGEDGPRQEAVPMSEQIPAVLKNRYFWLLLLIGIFSLLMNANAIGGQIFYCNVVLKTPC